MSHSTRTSAKSEVLPVLFSPTSKVTGASGTRCWARKHRKFDARSSRMRLTVFPRRDCGSGTITLPPLEFDTWTTKPRSGRVFATATRATGSRGWWWRP